MRIDVPSLRSASMSAHSSWRTCGSRPTVGSSSSSRRGRCTSARAISRRRRMPPDSSSTFASRRSVRFAISSARSIAALRSRARHAVEVREDEQVLLDGERRVEVVGLRRDAHLGARLLGVAGQRVAEHLELAGVGDRLRGQHLHRRRLAGAVGAEQADARALGHVEVEAVDGEDVAVVLDDLAQADGEGGHPSKAIHARLRPPGGFELIAPQGSRLSRSGSGRNRR